MNGLRFIRTQCNLSLNDIATVLGVSRQMVSSWENGEKEISRERAAQLSEYFGIDEKYFGEIEEHQKDEILQTTMYRWYKQNEEYFLFRPCKESRERENGRSYTVRFERTESLSNEWKEKKRLQKEMVHQINEQISGSPKYNLQDQILAVNRGNKYYRYCVENYEAIFEKSPTQKMCYYFRVLEVMKALGIALGIEEDPEQTEFPDPVPDVFPPEDYTYRIDQEFVRECAELIQNHLTPMVEELEKMDMRKKEKRKM